MRKVALLLFLFISLQSQSQSVFGYWYGNANVKTNSSASNYMVEMVLQPERGNVKGLLNYFFKNTYRSLQVSGTYNATTRQLTLYKIPVTYYGSIANLEVDCMMNLLATLRVSQVSSNLVGSFIADPDYKNMCPQVNFDLQKNADISKTDSVLKAISQYKEEYQMWQPSATDTLVAVDVQPRKVINFPVEKEFKERENIVVNEIEVESDSLLVSIYDNGEIDGDIISIFFNKKLIVFNQKLTHKSIRINFPLDKSLSENEISMFAENLGLIPPNTALMVIDDGKNKFELKISSSLEKTATIRVKRK
ncbi:MAG: hypothetical protein IPH18_00820 [Chitinophagaceae bacterium]|nr:hypothetical protein [Chitinophagaceae bacterium]MBK8951462.1 hypothetical protein [Chitinophagaceae bacterium]